jgi:hypothetical protein
MRQGDLLQADEVRTRIERAIAEPGTAMPSGRITS